MAPVNSLTLRGYGSKCLIWLLLLPINQQLKDKGDMMQLHVHNIALKHKSRYLEAEKQNIYVDRAAQIIYLT